MHACTLREDLPPNSHCAAACMCMHVQSMASQCLEATSDASHHTIQPPEWPSNITFILALNRYSHPAKQCRWRERYSLRASDCMPRLGSCATNYHSVVIVGAGLSGLQATNKLLSRYPDLLLVEASSRVGGRVQQVQASSFLVIDACF